MNARGLFNGTAESSLHRAYLTLLDISPCKCGNFVGIWQ
jgi:hypothetical protein